MTSRATRAVTAVVVAAGCVVALAVGAAGLQTHVREAEARVASAAHREAAVTDATRVLSLHLVNAQTAQRGYLLTHAKPLRAAYLLGAGQVAQDLLALRASVPVGEHRTRLDHLVRAQVALLARTALLEQQGRHGEAVALAAGPRATRLTSLTDTELWRTRRAAAAATHEARAAASRARAQRTVGLAAVGTVLLVAALGVLVPRRSRSHLTGLATAARFRRIFVEAPVGMAVLDLSGPRPGAFREVNASLCRLTGYRAAELEARDIAALTHPDDRPLVEAELRLAASGQLTGETGHRLWVRADGTTMPVKIDLTVLRDAAGRPARVVAHVEDVSAQKAAEERLLHEARHDPLTGLANRRLYWQLLGQALARAQRRGTGVGVCYLDVDDFKDVNDRYGHAVGDLVLQQLATRLGRALRAGDTAARLGGDEFAVVSEDVRSDADLEGIRRRLTALFDEPVRVSGVGDVRMRVSIGAVRGDTTTGTGQELTTRADAAMYAMKHDGDRAGAPDGR